MTEPRNKRLEKLALLMAGDFHFRRLDHRAIGESEEESGDVLDLHYGGVVIARSLVVQSIFDRKTYRNLEARLCKLLNRPTRDRAVSASAVRLS